MEQLFSRLAAFTLVALLAAPAVALADSAQRHYGVHDWRNYRQPSYPEYRPRHHHFHRYYGHKRAGRHYGVPRYGRGHSLVPPWPGYVCRPVVVIDRYRGHRAKGRGSLCYDHFGRAFVVPSSRYSRGYRY